MAGQIFNWDDAEIERRTLGIGPTLTAIFRRAELEGRTTNLMADRMAEERIAKAKPESVKAAE